MDKKKIDFSVGLALSLELLEQYQQSGKLHALIPQVLGVRGPCEAWVNLVQGRIVSCYIEGRNGQRVETNKVALSQMDGERGPFAWSLVIELAQPTSSPPLPTQQRSPDLSPVRHVPRQIAQIDLARIGNMPHRERMMVRLVLTMIDGRRDVEEIKAKLTLSSGTIDWALQSLTAMQVITIDE